MTLLVVFAWGIAGLALIIGLAPSFPSWPADIDTRVPHDPATVGTP